MVATAPGSLGSLAGEGMLFFSFFFLFLKFSCESLGCMFSHQFSGLCKYEKLCKSELCSFQHEIESDNKFCCQECEDKFPNEETLTKYVENKHGDEKNDEDEFHPCNTCEQVFNEI